MRVHSVVTTTRERTSEEVITRLPDSYLGPEPLLGAGQVTLFPLLSLGERRGYLSATPPGIGPAVPAVRFES